MGKPNDLTGKKFGRLTVLSINRKEKGKTYWNCKCECGTEKVVRGDHMQRTKAPTLSCGCLHKEQAKALAEKDLGKRFESTHGDSFTRFYKIFKGIQSRCNRETHAQYHNYGGRGIKCEWETYEDFKKDMYDSYSEHVDQYGEENTSIERIDVDGNYCKENCTWKTSKEQANNRQNTIWVIMPDGSKKALSILADELKISNNCLGKRYRKSKYNSTGSIPYSELITVNDMRKKVRCIETGMIFESVAAATSYVELKDSKSIRTACNNPNKTASGYHWEYYYDEED